MSFKDDNYYRILDVPEDASTEEIRRAYELASQTFKVDSLATYSLYSEEENDQILREITIAYMTLVDPVTREHYDKKLKQQKPLPLPEASATIENLASNPLPLIPSPKEPPKGFMKPVSDPVAPANSEESFPASENGKEEMQSNPAGLPESDIQEESPSEVPPLVEEKQGTVKQTIETSNQDPSKEPEGPKGFSELIEEHLMTRSNNRMTIAQKNKNTQKEVQDFLATIERFNGKVLKQIRELKNIDLEEVSQEICVRQTYLSAIENEEHFILPTATIYVKNFINSYARCLELPVQKVAEDYLRLYEAWRNQS